MAINFKTFCRYSIKESIADLKKLVEQSKADGDTHMAICDNGDLYSTIYLIKECKDAGLKPIIGLQHKYNKDISFWPKTNIGLKNLNIIATKLSKEIQPLNSLPLEDIFVLASSITAYEDCLHNDIEAYLELEINEQYDANNLSDTRTYIPDIRTYAKQHNIVLIPTSRVLYNEKKDALGHDYFTNYIYKSDTHLKTNDYAFKTKEEFQKLFLPSEIENVQKLADKITINIELGKLRLPIYDKLPVEFKTPQEYLRHLCFKRLNELKLGEQYRIRLEKELVDIADAQLDSYFLIVEDICSWATSQNIAKGGGRGSAVGSLVCFLLKITDNDPLEYGLIFERFYNSGRKGSLPDIDTDFEAERREEVISYIKNRWGEDRVFQIITFGTFGPSKAIKSALSLAQCSFEEQNRVTDLIWHKATSIDEAITHNPKFKEESERRKLLFSVAKQYEGACESYGKHAAGIIIAEEPFTNGGLPMKYHQEDNQYISAYDLEAVDAYGLLKIDILGLNTLNIIKRASNLIREKKNPTFNIRNIDLKDRNVYENIFHTGKTKGIFQLESQIGQKYSELVKPNSINEIADLVTLIRPGAMVPGQTKKYLEVRGGAPKNYEHPDLAKILDETYGACIYQEQVIKLCEVMAKMDTKKADSVRAAAGKKKKKLMESLKSEFINGCKNNNITEELAEKFWAWIIEFSGYSFNKSHAVGYARCAYETAYLKHYYPLEFYEASFNYVVGDLHRSEFDKLNELINDAKLFDINVRLPNIKICNDKFTITGPNEIRYGLTMIKGVGAGSMTAINACKNAKSFNEFVKLAIDNSLKKSVIEALIACGALDHFKITRNQMLADVALVESLTEKEIVATFNEISNIRSIPDVINDMASEQCTDKRKALSLNVPNIRRREKLRSVLLDYKNKDKFETVYHLALHERKYLGVPISVSETDSIMTSVSHDCLQIKTLPKGEKVQAIIHIEKIREIVTKNGKNAGQAMAFITGGDGTYTLDNIVVFPRQYDKFKDLLKPGRIAVINGEIGATGGLIANGIQIVK